MMIPSTRTLALTGGLALVALVVSLLDMGLILWMGLVGVFVGIALVDALWSGFKPLPTIERQAPSTLLVGVAHEIALKIAATRQRQTLQVYDYPPASFQVTQGQLPRRVDLPPQQTATLQYQITPTERGLQTFSGLQVRVLSRLGLWWLDKTLPLTQSTKVYPNYTSLARYTLLAAEQQLNQMGINQRPRRGEGQDFHQLREYREGDSMRQIDWKASARVQHLVTREYQEARDQEVLFLLDCGHRMAARDDAVSHFDHSLNAMLLLAHVALKQGDAVGMGTFGLAEPRWLLPHKGQYGLQQLLSHSYDLQPSTQAPDYYQAALTVMARQKRRALVIWVTNLRDEDLGDLLPALQLVRKRHPVVVASLQEAAMQRFLQQNIHSLTEALDYTAVLQHLQNRALILQTLQTQGIAALDTPPPELATRLVNYYLEMKRSQRM